MFAIATIYVLPIILRVVEAFNVYSQVADIHQAFPVSFVAPAQLFTQTYPPSTHRLSQSATVSTTASASTSSSTSSATPSAPYKPIALTFDDGPYGSPTERILEDLRHEHIHATFFLIGKNALKSPNEVKEILADGHVIGNHSFDHSHELATMASSSLIENTDRAESAIAGIAGVHPLLYRPPYGSVSPSMLHTIKSLGYVVSMWTVDPRDWDASNTSSEMIIDKILARVQPGSIILLHDGRDTQINYPRENTVNALQYLIEELKKRGYTFVTMDKLLHVDAYADYCEQDDTVIKN